MPRGSGPRQSRWAAGLRPRTSSARGHVCCDACGQPFSSDRFGCAWLAYTTGRETCRPRRGCCTPRIAGSPPSSDGFARISGFQIVLKDLIESCRLFFGLVRGTFQQKPASPLEARFRSDPEQSFLAFVQKRSTRFAPRTGNSKTGSSRRSRKRNRRRIDPIGWTIRKRPTRHGGRAASNRMHRDHHDATIRTCRWLKNRSNCRPTRRHVRSAASRPPR